MSDTTYVTMTVHHRINIRSHLIRYGWGSSRLIKLQPDDITFMVGKSMGFKALQRVLRMPYRATTHRMTHCVCLIGEYRGHNYKRCKQAHCKHLRIHRQGQPTG